VNARQIGVGGDLAGRAQAVDDGHSDVHQHHVGWVSRVRSTAVAQTIHYTVEPV
jgi:hypothetical protein